MNINILDPFERHTLPKFGLKTAIIDGEKKILFNELASNAKILATEIIQRSSNINKPIIVYLNKGADNIIANLGIIYSGNAYSNLDIKNPIHRINSIINHIDPELIICSRRLKENIILTDADQNKLIYIEDVFEQRDTYDQKKIIDRLVQIIDTDPLCIINTSGSTGIPKGVVLNHRSFIDFTSWAIEKLSISNNEIIGSLSPFYFDIYSFELCLCLTKNSTIVIIPEQLAIFPKKILDFLSINKVTFIFWVPTIMVNIAKLDVLSKLKLPNLKKILFAGEVFPTKHLILLREVPLFVMMRKQKNAKKLQICTVIIYKM